MHHGNTLTDDELRAALRGCGAAPDDLAAFRAVADAAAEKAIRYSEDRVELLADVMEELLEDDTGRMTLDLEALDAFVNGAPLPFWRLVFMRPARRPPRTKK